MSPAGAEEEVDYSPDESRKRRPTFEVSLSDESDSESEAARRSPSSSSSSRGQAAEPERRAPGGEAPSDEAGASGSAGRGAPAAARAGAAPPPAAGPAEPEEERGGTEARGAEERRGGGGEPPAGPGAAAAGRAAPSRAQLLSREQLERGGAAYRRLLEKMGQASDAAADPDSTRGGSQSSTAKPPASVPFKAAPRALKRRLQEARFAEGPGAVPKVAPRRPPSPRLQPPPAPREHRAAPAALPTPPRPPPRRGEDVRQSRGSKRPAPQPRGSAGAAGGGHTAGAKRAREICVSSGDEGAGEGSRGPGVAQGLHRVTSRADWTAGRRRTDRRLGQVHPGALVEVLEIVHDIEDRRVRGRIRYGGVASGWISLQSSDGGLVWVERVGDEALQQAREEFAAQEERHRVEDVDAASEQGAGPESTRAAEAGGGGVADDAGSVEIISDVLQAEQDPDDYVALLAGRMAAAEAHWAEARLAEELAVAAPPPPEASEEPPPAPPPGPEAPVEGPAALAEPAEAVQAGACDDWDAEAELPAEADGSADAAAQARSPSWDEDEDEEFVGLQVLDASSGAAGSWAAAGCPAGYSRPEPPAGPPQLPPRPTPPPQRPRETTLPPGRRRPGSPAGGPGPRPPRGDSRLAWARCGMVPRSTWDAGACAADLRDTHPGPAARGADAACGLPILRRLFGGICTAPQHAVDGEFELFVPNGSEQGLYSLPQPCSLGDPHGPYGYSDGEDSAYRWQDHRARPSYRKRLAWTAGLLSVAALLALARDRLPAVGGTRAAAMDPPAALARKLVLPPAAGGPRVGVPPPSGDEEPPFDCSGLPADTPQACSADAGGTPVLALAVLQATWAALDTEGDGRIDLAELRKAHRHVSEEAVDALFDGDADGNGQLSRGEFVAALAGHARAGLGERDTQRVPPVVRAAMAAADSNADGALDQNELHYVQHELGLSEAAGGLLRGEGRGGGGRLSARGLGAALARACPEAGAGALALAGELAAAVHAEGAAASGEAVPWWLQVDVGGQRQAHGPRPPEARAAWCCEHAGVGCAARPAGSGPVPAAAAAAHAPVPAPAPAPPGGRTPGGRTGAPGGAMQYDCEEFYSTWQTSWSASKKRWCCTEHLRGCERQPLAPTPSAQPGYDCVDGWFDWQRRWPPAQQSWCCAAFGQGCPPGRPDSARAGDGKASSAVSAPFHCDRAQSAEDAAVGWSLAKQEWCCRFHGLGCTARVNNTKLSPFNCESGLWEYQTGWSLSKRTWCCRNRGLGCPRGGGGGPPGGGPEVPRPP